MLPIALVLIQVSLHIRWSLGTGAKVTSSAPQQSAGATLPNLTMAATGLSLLGISLLLFVRSPFRMPIGERLFRLVWLGPIGGGFIRLSSRGVARRTVGTTVLGVTPAPSRSTSKSSGTSNGTPRTPPATPDRVASLEARVAALERWRDG